MTIGLTYTGSPEKHQNYVNWLRENEGVEVISLSAALDNAEALKGCNGLVLSGGIDIYPGLYGSSPEYPNRPPHWEEDRDRFEKTVLGYALAEKMPVLGVCRGLQLINAVLGGALVRDLGLTGNHIHKNEGNTDKLHPVYPEKGSLLYSIVGETTGEANSAHHQAIEKLGDGLRANCLAEDGVIEGIEWKDPAGKSFLLGVQWHPERMFAHRLRDTPLYQRIRDRFLDESRTFEYKKS